MWFFLHSRLPFFVIANSLSVLNRVDSAYVFAYDARLIAWSHWELNWRIGKTNSIQFQQEIIGLFLIDQRNAFLYTYRQLSIVCSIKRLVTKWLNTPRHTALCLMIFRIYDAKKRKQIVVSTIVDAILNAIENWTIRIQSTGHLNSKWKPALLC